MNWLLEEANLDKELEEAIEKAGHSHKIYSKSIIFDKNDLISLFPVLKVVALSFTTDRVLTLDICQTQDDLKVLEVNAFSTSGLYACDKDRIVEEVSKVAQDEHEQLF